MSEANRADLSFIREVSAGSTPSSGVYKIIPYTAAPDFSFNPNTVISNTIRSDRMIDDLKLVGIEAGGSVEFEFAYGQFDDLLAGAFYNSWNEHDTADAEVKTIKANALEFNSAGDIPADFKPSALLLFEDSGSQDRKVFTAGSATGADVAVQGLKAASKGDNFKVSLVGVDIDDTEIAHDEGAKTITVDNSNNKALFNDLNIELGDYIKISGGSVSAIQGYYRIVSAEDGTGDEYVLTYDQFIPDTYVSQTVASGRVYIYVSKSIKNGSLKQSYSILQRFQSQAAPNQAVFSGCVVNAFSLAFDTQAIITGSLGFLGLNSQFLSQNVEDERVKQAQAEGLLTSSDNVGKIFVGGSEVSDPNYIQSASFDLSNSARRQNAVGSVGSVGIAAGRSLITGSLSTYFGNSDLAKQVIANTESSLIMSFNDKGNRALVLDIPKIKFSAGSAGIEAVDTDIILPLEYQALRDTNFNYQAKLCAFPFV